MYYSLTLLLVGICLLAGYPLEWYPRTHWRDLLLLTYFVGLALIALIEYLQIRAESKQLDYVPHEAITGRKGRDWL